MPVVVSNLVSLVEALEGKQTELLIWHRGWDKILRWHLDVVKSRSALEKYTTYKMNLVPFMVGEKKKRKLRAVVEDNNNRIVNALESLATIPNVPPQKGLPYPGLASNLITLMNKQKAKTKESLQRLHNIMQDYMKETKKNSTMPI